MMANLGALASYPSPPIFGSSPKHQMASSMSPNQPGQPGFDASGVSGGSGGSDKGTLSSLNLGFLKNLTEKRMTRDGNPPKRRGPKPDSRPALTRRQELNRQAQRTHRERKELYIKALEDEVLRLKEIYSNVSQDKERLAEENRQLKQLLQQGGPPSAGMTVDDIASNPSIGGYTTSVSGSFAAGPSSHTSAFTPPPVSIAGQQGMTPPQVAVAAGQQHGQIMQQLQGQGQQVDGLRRSPGIDYEQSA